MDQINIPLVLALRCLGLWDLSCDISLCSASLVGYWKFDLTLKLFTYNSIIEQTNLVSGKYLKSNYFYCGSLSPNVQSVDNNNSKIFSLN